jgi:hypothetical protein
LAPDGRLPGLGLDLFPNSIRQTGTKKSKQQEHLFDIQNMGGGSESSVSRITNVTATSAGLGFVGALFHTAWYPISTAQTVRYLARSSGFCGKRVHPDAILTFPFEEAFVAPMCIFMHICFQFPFYLFIVGLHIVAIRRSVDISLHRFNIISCGLT